MPGCQFPSPGDLPTQGLNPGLLNCRWILYQLSHQGSPRILAWVAVVFSSESSFASSSCFLLCRPSCCWMTWLLPWTHRAALTRPVFTHRGHQTWRGRWNTLNCMCCSAIWLQSWRTEVRGAHQWVGNLGGGLRGWAVRPWSLVSGVLCRLLVGMWTARCILTKLCPLLRNLQGQIPYPNLYQGRAPWGPGVPWS